MRGESTMSTSVKPNPAVRKTARSQEWKYLEPRPQSAYRTYYIKGHRIRADVIWRGMNTEGWSPEEAATQWSLPVEVIRETVRYCELNRQVIEADADREEENINRAIAEGKIRVPENTNR